MTEEYSDPAVRFSLTEFKKALLVGVYESKEGLAECQEHLSELCSLAKTYGLDSHIIEEVLLRKVSAATFIGKGKAEEIATKCKRESIDCVIFDDEITPNQQRNLEEAIGLPVLDRTELILEVFAGRAQTKEAELQIELAKTQYQLPRIKRMWTHLSRQRASGGHLKGEGEKQIEIDRRLLRKRIHVLKKELEKVRGYRKTQREARLSSSTPIFGIVGYTNAGKSTLLKSLTQADVLVEDKLFATLDTTTRKFTLPNHQKILLIDTVGFIRKLPHTLVEAFSSTLEESLYTDVLLHVVDVSHPTAIEHAEETLEVLKTIGADNKPVITLLNKIDEIENRALLNQFRVRFPHNVPISAATREGFDLLFEKMIEFIDTLRVTLSLRIPQKEYQTANFLMQNGRVINLDYESNDILLEIEIPKELEYKAKPFIM